MARDTIIELGELDYIKDTGKGRGGKGVLGVFMLVASFIDRR